MRSYPDPARTQQTTVRSTRASAARSAASRLLIIAATRCAMKPISPSLVTRPIGVSSLSIIPPATGARPDFRASSARGPLARCCWPRHHWTGTGWFFPGDRKARDCRPSCRRLKSWRAGYGKSVILLVRAIFVVLREAAPSTGGSFLVCTWKVFAIGSDKPVTVETTPELVPSYKNFDVRSPLVTPAPDGVAIAGPGLPLTRPCTELEERTDLIDDTRTLLNPQVSTDVTIALDAIKEAYSVDLDNDGADEVRPAGRRPTLGNGWRRREPFRTPPSRLEEPRSRDVGGRPSGGGSRPRHFARRTATRRRQSTDR
jgi:hypothetical protein